MSAIAKEKPLPAPHAGTELFERLGALFSQSPTPSPKSVATEVEKSVRQMRHRGASSELTALRLVVHELAAQIDQVVPQQAHRTQDALTQAELARAGKEDALGDAVLEAAMLRGPGLMTTPESIRHGDEAMALAERFSASTLSSRIEKRELIGSGELQRALNVQRQAISGAMKAGRLFAFVGPSGENFYPAFYADPTLDRRAIEKVSKALGSLPAASKYYFFTEQSTLLQESPLAALRKGRLDDVLRAAAGFVER